MFAYIGLGSNLGDRRGNIDAALALIAERAGKVLALSGFYETEPWGYGSQAKYINAAAKVEASLPPEGLLLATQAIERELGREEKTADGRYRDRPIDIDILMYGDLAMKTDRLTIPHPLMHKREFVLRPLAEIAPALRHPVIGKTIADIYLDLLNGETP